MKYSRWTNLYWDKKLRRYFFEGTFKDEDEGVLYALNQNYEGYRWSKFVKVIEVHYEVEDD